MEPCLMCYGALLISGIEKIVYAYEDAMGGATITSRAVSSALTDASKEYGELKPQIVEKAKAIK
jgi:tRNA(Arg) A34 adenosine deaminase TadA